MVDIYPVSLYSNTIHRRSSDMNRINFGDVFETNEGGLVSVVEYQSWDKIKVRHNDEHGHISTVRSDQLRDGRIKNPYKPSVYETGFIGSGVHMVSRKSIHSPAYHTWRGMFVRCYSEKFHKKQPTYLGCRVEEKWHNFQVFAEWFFSNKNSQNSDFALDKDLRIGGNKIYSQETCSFVPQEINSLLTNRLAKRGIYPQGVSADGKRFTAQLQVDGETIFLGNYATPADAHLIYKEAKQKNVRRMAEKWSEHLHPEVYQYLSTWKF